MLPTMLATKLVCFAKVTTCEVPVSSCFDIFMPLNNVVLSKYAVHISLKNSVHIVLKKYTQG